jgi:hypothetical protein
MRRKRRRRPEAGETTPSTTEAVVLSAADVRADAALAARRLFKKGLLTSTAADDLFGPGHYQVPPDVRLSRDHALVAYLLPYAPSASVAAAAPAEGAALLVVRAAAAAAAAPKPLPPLAMVRAVTGAEFSPWFDQGDPCVYYVEPDQGTGRPACVRRRSVSVGGAGNGGYGGGTSEDGDAVIYDEPDPRFFVALTRTKDWKALVVNSHSKVSSEVRLLMRRRQGEGGCAPAEAAALGATTTSATSTPSLLLVAPRRQGVEYFAEHWRGRVLVLTNAPELFLAGEEKAAAGSAAVTAAAPVCAAGGAAR